MSLRDATRGRIDRSLPLRFTFDGRDYQGFAGDTLASALLANGVHLMGRSFKYHRPRGILAAGSEEPNALVTVVRDDARKTPNLRATQVELYDGLVAHSQNRWPSLAIDVGRVNDWLSRFFPAGFYYKTFMWPRKAWKSLYEPIIRRAAGLGSRPRAPTPIATHSAMRIATCSWSAAVPRALPQRSPRPEWVCASCSAMSRPNSAGACSPMALPASTV